MMFSDYFPNHAALVIGFVVGSIFLGSAVAPVIVQIWNLHPGWTFQQIFLIYCCCIMVRGRIELGV